MIKYFLIALLFACNAKSRVTDKPVHNITIKLGRSYKIDLEKETYTVYFMNGTNYDCKFTLTDSEKEKISEKVQDCRLDRLNDTILIKDYCKIFPKFMTALSFENGQNKVQVSIDQFCNKHYDSQKTETEQILQFLKFINEKVFSKPEVMQAPKTDIIYM